MHNTHDLETMPAGALLTDAEAAPLVGLKRSTLSTWRSRAPERGPRFIRVGAGAIRYRAGDLRAYLAACATGGGR